MTGHNSFLRRRSRSYMDRPVDRLPIRQRFLIVCEGERTEPNYFLKFPIPKNSVVDIRGTGANTASLVRMAIQIRDRASQDENIHYDQVWCVFDRDAFSAQNFNAAFQIAYQNGIQIAYSNEAFELWYVLHFVYLDTGISREDYCGRLTELLRHPYQKNSLSIYDELLPYQNRALHHAALLYDQYQPKNPEKDKPSTTVHLLVEELNKLNWENIRKKK
jgi:hypothetical protein